MRSYIPPSWLSLAPIPSNPSYESESEEDAFVFFAINVPFLKPSASAWRSLTERNGDERSLLSVVERVTPIEIEIAVDRKLLGRFTVDCE